MCDGVKALENLIKQAADVPERYETSWHLDKRVPIALILTVVGQAIFFSAVAGVMWLQVQINKQDITKINEVMPQVYKMVENTDHMKEDIQEMNSNLKALSDRLLDYAIKNGRGTGWHDGRGRGGSSHDTAED